METSEPKRVNPISNIIGVNLLRFGGPHMRMKNICRNTTQNNNIKLSENTLLSELIVCHIMMQPWIKL